MKQPHEYTPAERAQAYQAWIEGKDNIEFWDSYREKWVNFEKRMVLCMDSILRLKPTPNYRPFKPEEVPVGRVVRQKSNNDRMIILGVSAKSVFFWNGHTKASCEELLEGFTFADNGSPCGVLEG